MADVIAGVFLIAAVLYIAVEIIDRFVKEEERDD